MDETNLSYIGKKLPQFDMDHVRKFARVTRSNDGSITVEVIDEVVRNLKPRLVLVHHQKLR